MFNPNIHDKTDAAPGGASISPSRRPTCTTEPPPHQPGLVSGKPGVAANAGAGIPQSLRRSYEVAELNSAQWIRLPAPGTRCRFTSLSRTTLNEAIARGDIRAVTIRKPGAVRGIKLMSKASVEDWLARLDVQQNTGQEGAQ
jgi:hypothetical protein